MKFSDSQKTRIRGKLDFLASIVNSTEELSVQVYTAILGMEETIGTLNNTLKNSTEFYAAILKLTESADAIRTSKENYITTLKIEDAIDVIKRVKEDELAI